MIDKPPLLMIFSYASRFCFCWVLPLVALMLLPSTASATGGKPKSKEYKAGHYRLIDGALHSGLLSLVSDNELLVKEGNAAEPHSYAASQVRNFVMGTDSFTVLRKFDLLVNGVVTHYFCGMAQVFGPVGGLELYRLTGTMDVYGSTNGSQTVLHGVNMGLRYGLLGAAVGAATGAVMDKNSGKFQEQVMTVYLVGSPGQPGLQTIQLQTRKAREVMEQVMADEPEFVKKVHSELAASLTSDKILELFALYENTKRSK